jgi:23S rRNA pseudouridine1911/1915/1917 synthase
VTNPKILNEDEEILVIAKPAGLAVHATSPGKDSTTLVGWLNERYPDLERFFPKIAGDIWRPGIVHRLDQDTSGVMVIAKTSAALQNLQDQFRNRTTQKIYRALVAGTTDEQGEFSGAITRSDVDPTHQEIRRLSFSWSKGKAREAETTYRRLALATVPVNPTPGVGFTGCSYLELQPRTGRMHQLRVQLASAGWPILGDERYGTKASRTLSDRLGVKRQLLHALRLSFTHPVSGKRLSVCAPYSLDFVATLTQLDLPRDSC